MHSCNVLVKENENVWEILTFTSPMIQIHGMIISKMRPESDVKLSGYNP
jgi:hypothetical protein